MRTYSDCFFCFYRQTKEAIDFLNIDDILKIKIYKKISQKIARFPVYYSPPEMGYIIHKTIKKITGIYDPYGKEKKKYNDIALSLYDKIKKFIFDSNDSLKEAIKFAIAGNIIDFGVSSNFDFISLINKIHSIELNLDDFNQLKDKLRTEDNILYLGDNAGEIVFDRIFIELLIEKFNKKIVYVVRGEPIINDVTIDDAKYVGLDKICTIISNGSGYPGTILSKTSRNFRKLFFNSNLIISKGQGNFESLSDINAPIVFLLMAKCDIVAKHLNVPKKSFVIKVNT